MEADGTSAILQAGRMRYGFRDGASAILQAGRMRYGFRDGASAILQAGRMRYGFRDGASYQLISTANVSERPANLRYDRWPLKTSDTLILTNSLPS